LDIAEPTRDPRIEVAAREDMTMWMWMTTVIPFAQIMFHLSISFVLGHPNHHTCPHLNEDSYLCHYCHHHYLSHDSYVWYSTFHSDKDKIITHRVKNPIDHMQ
jgi:hypothetical protein